MFVGVPVPTGARITTADMFVYVLTVRFVGAPVPTGARITTADMFDLHTKVSHV